MQLQSTQPLLLTIKDVMRELNLGRSKVELLIKQEGLPVIRFGRAVRVNRRSLENWVATRERHRASK